MSIEDRLFKLAFETQQIAVTPVILRYFLNTFKYGDGEQAFAHTEQYYKKQYETRLRHERR